MRIALVDDHQLFLDGLKMVLGMQADIEVVGEAHDARQALIMVEDKRPDVAVVDVALPGINGIALAREIKRRLSETKVLMLSMHTGEEYVAQAIAVGATGYAGKDQGAASVVQAVRAVAEGKMYLPENLSREAVDEVLRDRDKAAEGPMSALSAREREVYDLLVRGFSNDGVAAQLFISVKTVETHRARILRKLRVHSIGELIRFAALHGAILD